MKNKVPKLRFPEFSGEWEENRFSELVKDNKKITYGVVKPGGYFENGICLIKASDYSKKWNLNNLFKISKELDNSYKRSRVQAGDILFTIVGSVGNIAIVPPELSNSNITQQTARMSINENFSNLFIYNFLMTTFNKIQIRNYLKEGVQPSINLSDLEKFLIIVPPLPEQEKIASFLSEVDTKIEKLEKKKELLSQYKKGMMQKLFSQKLRFKDENGNDYPEWEESNLEKLAEINPKTEAVPEKFIYIDLESVEKGLLKSENIVLKNEAPSRAQRVLKSNDILYQTVRPYQKNNFYFKNMNRIYPFVASTGYAQIRTSQNSKYLYHFLHTDKFVASVLERCTGTSYPAINSSDLKLIKINIPSLPEQEKIANFLSSIDRKIELVEEELEKNKEFKKGLLQQMFV
ncbi:restriction endonuclease subunit S [Cetobacterium sp.]|uniref:restriction endonuclease subunit S n=1 Tax=Cetobacterium sp. TaxID=2071632 RepID=UPI003F36FDAB